MFKFTDQQARAHIIAAYILSAAGIVAAIISGIFAFRADASKQQAQATSSVLAGAVTQSITTQAALMDTIDAPTAPPLPTQTPYPTYTLQPTHTPYPTYTPRPTLTDVPPPSATSTPSLVLPFEDNFDNGVRSEWMIIGDFLIDQGKLGSAGNRLTLQLGDQSLQNYTVQFNYEMPSSIGGYSMGGIVPFLGTDFRLLVANQHEVYWQARLGGEWQNVQRLFPMTAQGLIRFSVSGNTYVWISNNDFQLSKELTYGGAKNHGPFIIDICKGCYIDNFKMTSP